MLKFFEVCAENIILKKFFCNCWRTYSNLFLILLRFFFCQDRNVPKPALLPAPQNPPTEAPQSSHETPPQLMQDAPTKIITNMAQLISMDTKDMSQRISMDGSQPPKDRSQMMKDRLSTNPPQARDGATSRRPNKDASPQGPDVIARDNHVMEICETPPPSDGESPSM